MRHSRARFARTALRAGWSESLPQRDSGYLDARRAAGWVSREPFVAIDFEISNASPLSAHELGAVRIEGGQITERLHVDLVPIGARQQWGAAGLARRRARERLRMDALWPRLLQLLRGAEFVVAHNAPFDRRVLAACSRALRLPWPDAPWACSLQLARHVWGLHPAGLAQVAGHLNLPLLHHHPLSDAEACAGVVLAARSALEAG